MENILRQLLSNDSDAVREASKQLKEKMKTPGAIPELCTLLSNHPDADIRQYAALVLRKRFDKKPKWEDRLDPQIQQELRSGVLQIFIKEPEKSVKNSLVQLIGSLMTQEPPWTELMAFLQQSMTSADTNDKELGFYMLSILTEMHPDEMEPHAQAFLMLFNQTLSQLTDKASPVGYFIMLCMANMIAAHKNKNLVHEYNQLIPKTFEVIYALAEKRPDRAAESLSVYYELATDKAPSLASVLNSKIKPIVSLCLELTQKSKNDDLQIKSLSFISILASTKVKQLFKDGMMQNILMVIFNILKEPPLDDEEEQYFSTDLSEDTLLTTACETLDSIALNADSKKLMNIMMQIVEPLLKSANPYEKKAGFLAMGIACQGCESYIRNKHIGALLTVVKEGIVDPNPVVRNAALFTLGEMGEYLQPEISSHAMEVMPLLIGQLDRIGEEGKSGARLGQKTDKVFYAIDRFSETLETSLSHFLGEMIPRLLLLASPPYHSHIRELALEAIATATNSVEGGISPYFNDIMTVLNQYLNPQAEAIDPALQVEAIDTLAMLARHVGQNEFGPFALDSVKLGLQLVATTDDPDVRKSSYGLFGSVSNVLKEEMGPLLESIVAPILNSIKDQDAFLVHNKDDTNAAFPLFGSDDENEDDDDISIENDYAEEKEEACFALKELAANTGASFAPHLEASIEEVYKLLTFPSTDVRKAALEAEAQFCISFVKIMYNASQGDNKLAFIIIEKLVAKTLEMIKTDFSKEVACSGCECIQQMLKEIGPQIGCLDQMKINIINTIRDVLESKTECQSIQDCDDDTTDEELIDVAAETIPALAHSMTQQDFKEVFINFLPLIKNRMMNSPDSDEDDDEDDEDSQGSKANAIGVLAECMAGLGTEVKDLVSGLFSLLLPLTRDPSANVRNNSLYTLGEMCFHGREHLFQYYPTLLNALSQVLATEKKPKVMDNACGVIARMILINNELLPLQQVFKALVDQLPLKEDFSEDVWVMRSIAVVVESYPEIAQPLVFPILQDIGFTLYAHSPSDECKEVLLNLFRLMFARYPQECQETLPQLPEQVPQILRQAGILPN